MLRTTRSCGMRRLTRSAWVTHGSPLCFCLVVKYTSAPHPVITSKACTTRHFHLGRKYARRRWSSTKRETTTAPYDATGWSSGKRNAFSCPRPLRKGKVSVGVKLEIPGCRAFQPAPQASKQTKETEASSVSHDLTKGQGNMRLRENAMFAHTGEEQRLFPGYCLPH